MLKKKEEEREMGNEETEERIQSLGTKRTLQRWEMNLLNCRRTSGSTSTSSAHSSTAKERRGTVTRVHKHEQQPARVELAEVEAWV